MGYSSSKLDQYEAGDIICYRLTGNENYLLCNVIAKLQSALKGCEGGHKNSIHMAIVTEMSANGIPMIAHISEPNNIDLTHRSYQGRHIHGMPKIEPLSESYASNSLMVIRNKNPIFKTAIAHSAIQAVESHIAV